MKLTKGGKRLDNFNKAYKRAKDKQRREIKKAAQATGLKEYEIKEDNRIMAKLNIPIIPKKSDLRESIEAGNIKNYNARMKLLTAYTDRKSNELIKKGNGKNQYNITRYELESYEANKKIILDNNLQFLDKLREASKTGEYMGQHINTSLILKEIDRVEKEIDMFRKTGFNKINTASKFKIANRDVAIKAHREYDDVLRHKHIQNTIGIDWAKNLGKKRAEKLLKKAEKVGWDNIRTLIIGGNRTLEWRFPYTGDSDNEDDKEEMYNDINDTLNELLDTLEEGAK